MNLPKSQKIKFFLKKSYRRGADLFHRPYLSDRWMDAEDFSVEKYCLIAGAARSGTTLCSSILGAHSNVFSPVEYGFLTKIEFDVNRFAELLELEPEYLKTLAKETPSRIRFIDEVMRLAAQYHEVDKIITKSPNYTHHLSRILRDYPNAKVIYMHRNCGGVVNSIRKNARELAVSANVEKEIKVLQNLDQAIKIWKAAINAYRPFIDDARVLPVSYERLVSNPYEVVQGICEFLDIPFEEQMIKKKRTGLVRNITEYDRSHLTGVKKDLYTKRINAWKWELREDEIDVIERKTRHEAEFLQRIMDEYTPKRIYSNSIL